MTAPTPPVVRPLDSARHPFELFVLAWGLVVALPLLVGAPAPGSTTELLGPTLARVWAFILAGGCLVALVGAWWTWWGWLGRRFPRVRPSLITGLLVEMVGLVAVGVGASIYAVGVLDQAGLAAGVPAGIVGGFGLACWWRSGQIYRWVTATIRALELHR